MTLSADLPSYPDFGWRHATSKTEMKQIIDAALDTGTRNVPGWMQFGRNLATDQPGDRQLRVVEPLTPTA